MTSDEAGAGLYNWSVETHIDQPLPAGLWELGITELSGHNIEAHGREEVNRLLKEGWILLHVYTLHYHDDGIWRQRPMAILGRAKPAER